MNDINTINWSELYAARRRIQQRYRKIWNVPIDKRYASVLFKHGFDGSNILEMGAGSRGLQRRISDWWPSSSYKSYDIDTNTKQDYYKLEDIEGQYEMVCMFEVVEHVRPEVAKEMLDKCFEVLVPGGLLFITTPNIYYPPNYLRDATHITPWCYDELGALALMTGFELQKMYRLYSDSFLGKLTHRMLFYPIHRAMGIDFAKQIIMVSKKPENA